MTDHFKYYSLTASHAVNRMVQLFLFEKGYYWDYGEIKTRYEDKTLLVQTNLKYKALHWASSSLRDVDHKALSLQEFIGLFDCVNVPMGDSFETLVYRDKIIIKRPETSTEICTEVVDRLKEAINKLQEAIDKLQTK